jgi:hypothetical protein
MIQLNMTLKALTSALIAVGLGASTSVWAQAAAPAMPDALKTRAEVKEETKAAQRTGDIPQGEAGATKDRPMGGAKIGTSTQSRADVKSETKRARAAGEIPTGEGLSTSKAPKGGAPIGKGSDTTRLAVKAEAARAAAAGEIPQGEGGVTSKEPKGGPKIPALTK